MDYPFTFFIAILMILTKYLFNFSVRLTEQPVTVGSVTLRFYCTITKTVLTTRLHPNHTPHLSDNVICSIGYSLVNELLDLRLFLGGEIDQLSVQLLLFSAGVLDPLGRDDDISGEVVGIQYERLEAASMCVMQGRGCGRDLLPHVALDEGEQLRGKVKEVRDDGVHGNEVEGQLRVQVRVVVGLHAWEEMGEGPEGRRGQKGCDGQGIQIN